MEGTVKFYNRTKRFGFIAADDGKEVFFHESGLEPGTNVKDNDKVSFEIVDGDRGQKAEKIKLLGGGSSEETEADSTEEDNSEESTEEPKEEAASEEDFEEASEETEADSTEEDNSEEE